MSKIPSDRLIWAANVLLGYRVEIQLNNGKVFEGVFHSISDGKAAIKYAKILRAHEDFGSDKEALAEKPKKLLVIEMANLVQIVAKDVRLNVEDLRSNEDRSGYGFETDADISKGCSGNVYGRDLVKWAPDENDDSLDMLDMGAGGGGSGWDQFAANRQLFGVETTFDEHFYTTVIDKQNCAITEEEAERLAKEIEGQAAGGNLHMMEERGYIANDSGDMDEEDKYSAVIRPSSQHNPSRLPLHAAGSRASAWGGIGSGVAVVAGRSAGGENGPPPPPPYRLGLSHNMGMAAGQQMKVPYVEPGKTDPSAALSVASSPPPPPPKTTVGGPSVSPAGVDVPAPKKSTFTFNPNAKAFTLSASAKPFVPPSIGTSSSEPPSSSTQFGHQTGEAFGNFHTGSSIRTTQHRSDRSHGYGQGDGYRQGDTGYGQSFSGMHGSGPHPGPNNFQGFAAPPPPVYGSMDVGPHGIPSMGLSGYMPVGQGPFPSPMTGLPYPPVVAAGMSPYGGYVSQGGYSHSPPGQFYPQQGPTDSHRGR